MTYQLTLEKFSGPLGLLLNLVEEQKLSINEISLAEIAEKYIVYLKSLEEMPKDELAAFLVIASTLMLIKSRSLLPGVKLSEEEEMDIKELETRLKTFQFFKELSQHIRELNKTNRHLFGREAYLGMSAVFFPPEGLKIGDFKKMMDEILEAVPKTEKLPEGTLGKMISIEDKMAEIQERLNQMLALTFDELKNSAREKIEVIVSFLAMLELVKQGWLILDQQKLFGGIELKKNGGTR
ncbi:MAG: segregation/condensation protein A [bacterium]|nr:segregation/condensation protein A [bacterium]